MSLPDETRRPSPSEAKIAKRKGHLPDDALPSEVEALTRARLAEVFEQAPAFIATLRGPEHAFEMANPAYLRLVGGRDVVGRGVREVFPELRDQGFFEALDHVYATGEPFVGTETPVLLQRTPESDPETLYLNFVYQALKEPDGSISGILAHGVDVSDMVRARHQAEEQASELEAQSEELQNQAAQLEEIQVELESSNDDLVTANREAEIARGHLEAVLRQMPSGVVLAEAPSGRLTLGNDQVERIWRQPFLKASDVSEYEGFKGVHPDGRLYRPEEWPLARALNGDRVIGEEIEIIRGDGTHGIISVSSTPVLDRAGDVTAAVAIFDDISERKQQEADLQYLVETARVLSSSLDYHETLRSVARLSVPRIADWCAVDVMEDDVLLRLAVVHSEPEKEALAEEIASRWPTDPDAAAGVPNVLRTGEPELYHEITDEFLRVLAQDEEHFRTLKDVGLRSAMIVPLNVRGRTLGAITFVSAESGRRFGERDLALAEKLASRAAIAVENARLYDAADEARQDAERAQRRAEESSRSAEAASSAKSDFLAKMSHEIRTPLNAVIGYADLLHLGLGGPLNAKQQEQVDRIRVSGQHLLGLVDEVLDLARVESGQMQVQHTQSDVTDAVSSAVSLVGTQAEKHAVEIDVECAGDSTVVYVGDDARVRQILVNIIGNAVKFSNRGSRVVVRCGISDGRGPNLNGEPGPWTYVEVQDSGIGIVPEQLDAIFRPFVQAQAGYTRESEGTGLGLTISRQLAILMGGDISVDSTPGEGSTFTLWLPTRMPAEDALFVESEAYAPPRGLEHVGSALIGEVDHILGEYRDQLRRDPAVPMSHTLTAAEIEDHHSSLLADLGAGLVVLAEPSDAQERLMRDGSQIQRTVAELHGRQRAQLGWTEEALAREFEILWQEIVRRMESAADPARADVEACLNLLKRFLDRAEKISVRGLRVAATSAHSGG